MTFSLPFGQQPLAASARVSSSSSPQPSMSSSSESPMTASMADFSFTTNTDKHSESRRSSRLSSDDIVPKTEETELQLADVKVEPSSADGQLSPTEPVRLRRGRGRPRIFPPRSPVTSKQAKARSKTGCTTCRKRKKKCDETRPFCLSCQKNNIHCEGYRPVEVWKSGKEKAADARKSSVGTHFKLPPLMEGVEEDIDRMLLQHFVSRASCVLSLHDQSTNPFTRILLPMALQHKGLMHSVLCLSASHLCSLSPSSEYESRQAYHRGKAFSLLNADLEQNKSGQGQNFIYEDSNVAQILLHLLHAICDGNTSGEYKIHMDAARKISVSQRSNNPEFQTLFDEFFYYHYIASQVTSLDGTDVPMMDDFNLPFQINPDTAALIGVSDGLFGFISKISNLRRRLRARIDEKSEPVMDYEALLSAHAIDSGLRTWVCPQTPNTARYTVSMLYRQAVWVYLFRTTKHSRPHPSITSAVDDGIKYINDLPADGPIQSNVLLPLFLIGCAAFEESQRVQINRAFDGLAACTGLGNITHAKNVVDKIWELMDAEDPESWDWEKIIHSKGWSFLAT